MSSSILGLDVGGANIKMAHTNGFALHHAFALWKQPKKLAQTIQNMMRGVPECDRLAVTMTGELCDCFETKREGVNAIIDAVESAAGSTPIDIWTTNGEFLDPHAARRKWLKVASANWLATATWAGRLTPKEPALLVDIGSTTTDIIPIWNGKPMPLGLTDSDRLKTGELVYTGASRTPACAVLGSDGMAEFFATTLDAYLILNRRAEDADDCDTADGRPATRQYAHGRLARMMGGDPDMTPPSETQRIAELIATRQANLIRAAVRSVASRLPERPTVVITAGTGEGLADAITDAEHGWTDVRLLSLGDRIGLGLSHSVCAYAVAVLDAERVSV